MAAVTICSDIGASQNSHPLFPSKLYSLPITILGAIVPKHWNWGSSQKFIDMSPAPEFVFLMLESSVLWSTKSQAFSPEHHLVLLFTQVFVFWFSYQFSCSFDQATQPLDGLFFRPFSSLFFLIIVNVFAFIYSWISVSTDVLPYPLAI